MKRYIGAIDQGTTSTRFILFDRDGRIRASHQLEHRQIFPVPGWVEHDPVEIWNNTKKVILAALRKARARPDQLASIGITNQRETTVVFDPKTGKPWYNAIVWQDTRTAPMIKKLSRVGGKNRFKRRTGLPLATYFSGPKVRWILDNVKGVREAVLKGRAVFGTMDTWIIWQLTGGPDGGRAVIDVTNASRTMLMNIRSLEWDRTMLRVLGIPARMLPEIRPSIDPEPYGFVKARGLSLSRVPVSADLGDQQAALFGQTCFSGGSVKNTYGTGCFMLANTGHKTVFSRSGLVTTVAYRIGKEKPVYALEGSVAIAGALVQWLRDNLGLIKSAPEINGLAREVKDNGGVYFVPAFSGLFAPYWKANARGVIAGLTRYVNRGHLARAVLEATAFQTREIFDAMVRDTGLPIRELKVDGGMVASGLLMQFQSDILDRTVVRPSVIETTALGAAYGAGLAVKFWKNTRELSAKWKAAGKWRPRMKKEERERLYAFWLKAVKRTFDWTGK